MIIIIIITLVSPGEFLAIALVNLIAVNSRVARNGRRRNSACR